MGSGLTCPSFLTHIEILRIPGLYPYPKRMSSAPCIHCKDVNPVLLPSYNAFKLPHHITQLAIRKEAFIHRLLPSGAVSFQEIAHIVKASAVRNVIGYEIESPAHENRINGMRLEVSKRNVSEMFLRATIILLHLYLYPASDNAFRFPLQE